MLVSTVLSALSSLFLSVRSSSTTDCPPAPLPARPSPFFEAAVLKVPHCEARCPSRDFISRRNVVRFLLAGIERRFESIDAALPWPLTGVHKERSAASRMSRNLVCVTRRAAGGRGIFHKIGQFLLSSKPPGIHFPKNERTELIVGARQH